MISIIFPTLITTDKQLSMSYNAMDCIKRYTTVPYELIVVETQSSYFVEDSDIHIYEKNKCGTNKSLNKGFKLATGDYIMMLSNDVFVKPGYCEAMLECFKRYEDCIVSTTACTQFNHFAMNKIEPGNWWGMFLIDGKWFRKVGFLDEGYMAEWSDTDLIMAMASEGKQMYRNFNVVVEHLVGQTEYSKSDHTKSFVEGRERFINKWKNSGLPVFNTLI